MPITRTTVALAVLATLAALGLAAQPAARAQSLTLNSGDAVTVSGAGTIGTIGGQPVANTTSSYSGSSSAVMTNDTSTFTLSTGGTLTGTGSLSFGLYAFGSGLVTITGGTLTVANGDAFLASGSGLAIISGGTFSASQGIGLLANGTRSVTVTGGTFSGGSYGLLADSRGTLNLFSQGDTPFLINGVPMNNMTLGRYTSGTNTISGTLLDGETLNTTFFNSGIINLNVGTPPAAAPEPSQFAALAVGLLGLGALALKAHKRHAA